jgi:hypothetical protein
MRIVGALLVLAGLLLCLTVIGIPFGIFLIFVGIICAALGSRRRVVVNNVVQVAATPGANMQANVTDDRRSPFRTIEPSMHRPEPLVDVTPRPAEPALTNESRPGFDKAKWSALVEYDPEIARVVGVLQPYGQKYVDQLAAAYLAINDKDYLPMILQKIVDSARKESGGGVESVAHA